jgi:hypothetical protein
MEKIDKSQVDLGREIGSGGEASIWTWKLEQNGGLIDQESLLKIYKPNQKTKVLQSKLRTIESLAGQIESTPFRPWLDRSCGIPLRVVAEEGEFVGFEQRNGYKASEEALYQGGPNLVQIDKFLMTEREIDDLGMQKFEGTTFVDFALQTCLIMAWLHSAGFVFSDFNPYNLLVYRLSDYYRPRYFPFFVDLDALLKVDDLPRILADPEVKATLGESELWSPELESIPSMPRDVWRLGLLFARLFSSNDLRPIQSFEVEEAREMFYSGLGDAQLAEILAAMIDDDPEKRPHFVNVLECLAKYGAEFESYLDLLEPLSPRMTTREYREDHIKLEKLFAKGGNSRNSKSIKEIATALGRQINEVLDAAYKLTFGSLKQNQKLSFDQAQKVASYIRAKGPKVSLPSDEGASPLENVECRTGNQIANDVAGERIVAPAAHLVVDGSNVATKTIYDSGGKAIRKETDVETLMRFLKVLKREYPDSEITCFVDSRFRWILRDEERQLDFFNSLTANGTIQEINGGISGGGDNIILHATVSLNAIVVSNDKYDKWAVVPQYEFLKQPGRRLAFQPLKDSWIFKVGVAAKPKSGRKKSEE